MNRVAELVELLRGIEGSSFEIVRPEWIDECERHFSTLPEDLKALYQQLGYGSIGQSGYMIHMLLEPADVYDERTAESLNGVVIVGDDYAGTCEAYDAGHGWLFGHIGANGRFEVDDECRSFVDFLIDWFSDPENREMT